MLPNKYIYITLYSNTVLGILGVILSSILIGLSCFYMIGKKIVDTLFYINNEIKDKWVKELTEAYNQKNWNKIALILKIMRKFEFFLDYK